MKKVIILMIISLNLFSKEILRDFTTLKLKNGIYYNNVDGEKFTGEVIYSKDGYEYDVNYVKGIKEGKSTEKYLKDNYLYRESFYIKGMLTSYKIYFKNGRVKLEIALVKGKKEHDKRESIKKRDVDLELRQTKRSFRD